MRNGSPAAFSSMMAFTSIAVGRTIELVAGSGAAL
jgi:hypothetical protein